MSLSIDFRALKTQAHGHLLSPVSTTFLQNTVGLTTGSIDFPQWSIGPQHSQVSLCQRAIVLCHGDEDTHANIIIR